MAKWYEYNNGDRVRVVRADDHFCEGRYMGHVGKIYSISYGGTKALVGESRTDPYSLVEFADGTMDGFFLTELDLVPHDTPLTTPVKGDGELVLLEGD